MIGLIMLGSVINYLTRSSLAVAAPTILHDLHITEKQYSWIVGAFQGTIMAQPICGYVMDVLGLKIGFAGFALAWSITNMAHGLAGSWQAFAFLRGLLGFSEGSANPAGMKATAEWFPARERGLAGGLFNTGASVGSMLAPPLVAWAILTYNWRLAFVMTGSLGLIWVLLCYGLFFINRPPSTPRFLTRSVNTSQRGRRNTCKATAPGLRFCEFSGSATSGELHCPDSWPILPGARSLSGCRCT
jgi:MFS transporter, ACS family, hexuronate transporter